MEYFIYVVSYPLCLKLLPFFSFVLVQFNEFRLHEKKWQLQCHLPLEIRYVIHDFSPSNHQRIRSGAGSVRNIGETEAAASSEPRLLKTGRPHIILDWASSSCSCWSIGSGPPNVIPTDLITSYSDNSYRAFGLHFWTQALIPWKYSRLVI
jgi:hypothetical protein